MLGTGSDLYSKQGPGLKITGMTGLKITGMTGVKMAGMDNAGIRCLHKVGRESL